MAILDNQTGTHPIWEGLLGEDESGVFLVGGCCSACGFVTLGIRDVCPECWASATMSAVPIGRTGTLYSCTVIHAVPAGFSGEFAVGYVDVENEVRVFAHLERSPETLRIGEPLVLIAVPLRRDENGTPLVGPLYKAAHGISRSKG